jgi:hypothetical protein
MDIDEARASAKYDAGVLTLTLPKKAATQCASCRSTEPHGRGLVDRQPAQRGLRPALSSCP